MSRKRRSFVLTQSFKRSERREVDGALLVRLQSLYEAGHYLDAFVLAGTAGPLQAWRGADALELASRLAGNIGNERLGRLLILRAHRDHPLSAKVGLHHAYHLLDFRGPMAAWEQAVRFEARKDISEESRADFLALRARVAAGYRDFETAEALLEAAFALRPRSPWLQVEKATILGIQEQREEALAALDEALVLRPWFRPAVQHRARLLHVLNRPGEAVEFLTRSLDVLQSAAVALQLLHLKREADDDAGMLELLERLETLSPMRSAAHQEWLAARRADALCLNRDFSSAATQAELACEDYYAGLAKRLRAATGLEKRVRLPFGFIPQGHRTCGPATLAAIAQHLGKPVTQESIVEAICYDGTYDHSERRWCESNGFAAREFKVTWDALRPLLDAGVPFALATVEVGSAHLQAVIGYDELRETLFIQDPSEPHYREVPAREFLDSYKLTGPRGLVLVPEERRSWLEKLALPEAELFDLHHVLQTALGHHRRDEAVAALEELDRRDPGGRLPLLARLALGTFDGNTLERSRTLERLLQIFPDDQRLLAWRLFALREIGRSEERLALLRRAVRLEDADPFFTKELAVELAADMRQRREVRRMFWQAHRMLPMDPSVLTEMADWEWRRARNEELLHFYRFASAVSDKNEGFARTWFSAASAFGRSEQALEWLRRRFESFGAKSGGPAITLSECLDRLDRTEEALAVLAAAIARRPDDGELLVYASRMELRCGLLDQAGAHLELARGHCPPRVWLRASAWLHDRRGERAEALRTWREVLRQEPLAVDAHEAVVDQLACLEGEDAAQKYLEGACERFPHHYGLSELLLRRLRSGATEAAEAAARRLVELHSSDPWSRRELAIILKDAGRASEALAFSQSAIDIAPDQAASHGVHASVLAALGREAEASEEFRRAIRCDVNYGWALGELVDLAHSTEAKRAALAFVREQMEEQVLNGAALHAYRRVAFPILEAGELVTQLREIWQSRPDLWEAWSILASQELDAGNKEEAERLATEATRRFPLLPAVWRDQAMLQRILGKTEESLRAIRRALDLNPDWPMAWQELARFLEESKRPGEAIERLRAGLKRLPLEEDLRLNLAGLLWRAGEREEAWALAARVAEAEPGRVAAWESLREWAPALHHEQELVDLARRITEDRPGEARSWMILASVLPLNEVEEELRAYDTAIARNPRLVDAYDLKATVLVRQGRFDAAEAVLRQGPWDGALPVPLRGRLAWLKASQGKTKEALAEMTAIVEENRDYYWGWERVAEWGEQSGEVSQWQRAARELIRLAPRDAAPYCHAAAVEFHLKNDAEAAALLERALQLEPGHSYAARRLMELRWEKRDASALEALPTLLLQGGYTLWVSRVCQTLAAAIREDAGRVRVLLPELLASPDDIRMLADLVQRAFLEGAPKLQRIFLKLLGESVSSDRIGPAFACVWVRQESKAKRWGSWKRFGAWIRRMKERADWAIVELLDQIGDSGQAAKAVPALIREHRSWLEKDTFLWGKTGYALANSHLHGEGVRWLQGGENRPDAEGWMLANLVACLRGTGRHAEASEVSLTVVRRGLRDHTWSWHVSQAAIGAAQRQDLETARNLLPLTGSEELKGGWAVTYALASSLCRVLPAPAGQARTLLAEEHQRLRALARTVPNPTAALVTEYRTSLDLMLRHSGTWMAPWKKRYPRKATVVHVRTRWLLLVVGLVVARSCGEYLRTQTPAPVQHPPYKAGAAARKP